MKLPGIVTIEPDQTDLIDHAAEVLGTSFLEEPWFDEWLRALDPLGVSAERKREIMIANIKGCFLAHAPHQAVYATEDFAGIAGGYLASEFGDNDHEELEEKGFKLELVNLLTSEEAAALTEADKTLAPVSDFSWARGHANGADHIYFYAWAVDPNKRGTGAFRRLTQPFFDYADEHGINCYLECYSDKLQSLYEHVGFEVVRTLESPSTPIVERCMVRKPQTQ